MGRVKDYILQAGENLSTPYVFKALDPRGNHGILWSIPLTLATILRIWSSALLGRVALVHVNAAERVSLVRKGLIVFCARLAGLPVVLHLHAAELVRHYRQGGFLVRELIRLPFRMATCNVVLGNTWRDWLENDLKIQSEKIAVVTNGVPVKYVPKPPSAFAKESFCTFLFLGNLQERKGFPDFLQALAKLPKDDPSWRVVAAGGGDIPHYKKVCEDLNIGGRIRFTGWIGREQTEQLLRETDVLVLPSYEEGLPLVILEALGSGLPVIATPVGAIPEVLEDGRSVLLVPPGDIDTLANRMTKLLQNPLLRQTLSEAGLKAYQEKFTLQRFTEALFSVYRRQCGVSIERVRP